MNIIFDFDGTIANSLDIVLAYANKLLERSNQPLVTRDEFRTKGFKEIKATPCRILRFSRDTGQAVRRQQEWENIQ